MRVDCALLCDAATVREGLLFILGGGITRIRPAVIPAPLNTAFAMRVMVHPTEAGREHDVEILLQNADGEQVAKVDIKFGVEVAPTMQPGEELSAAFALPLHQVALPAAGGYSFEVLIGGIHQASVPFFVEAPA